MKLFPVFPVLFPVCSQSQTNEFLVFPVFRISSQDPYGYSASLLPYSQQPGTLGTLGTGLKRHELGSVHTWNRLGTLGTAKRD